MNKLHNASSQCEANGGISGRITTNRIAASTNLKYASAGAVVEVRESKKVGGTLERNISALLSEPVLHA